MTFLTPIPALIAAAVTVPLLLTLYFLKLRRRPVRVSSTLLWSDAVRDLQVNVPFRWLRPSWLLFLQLLILACFLAALARPAIRTDAAPSSRVILLIDRSASMSATDGPAGQTRLEAAKAEAIELLDSIARAGSGVRAAVVAFAAEPVALTGFSTDRSALRSAVIGIEPTDQPGDLAAALELAGAMLRSAAGDADETSAPEPGAAVLFSDGSFETSGPLTLAGASFRYVRVGPPAADADGAPAGRDNLGITAISARRDYDDPAIVRVFVRFANASAAPVPVPVVLTLDGRAVQREPLVIPGAPADDPASPGQLSTTFELNHLGSGIVTVTLDRPDALEADNSASLVLQPAARPRVLVVIPAPPPTADGSPPPPGPEWLLTDVLGEMDLRSLRVLPAPAYDPETASQVADLVIFDRVRPGELPRVPSIHFGAGVPLRGVALAAPPEPGEGPSGTYFLSWQRTHPLLREVALDQVFVGRPRPIRLSDPTTDAEGTDPAVIADELARGRQGALIVLLEHRGVRRLMIGFELVQSNWPAQFSFPIFLAEAVDYLTLRGDDRAGIAFRTTEPAEVRAPSGGPFALRGPIDLTVNPRDSRAGERVNVGVIPRAGVYRAEGGEGPASVVAVNMASEHESALGVADALRVGGEAVAAGAGDGGPREVWHWFVLAAFVLLALEWFLHAWFTRV